MRALREARKKKAEIQNDGGGGERTRINVAEEQRKKKRKKTSTMQLRSEQREGDEWTTCSGGVLLAGFRGVEILYNVRDVCVDSFNPLLPRDGYRGPLS